MHGDVQKQTIFFVQFFFFFSFLETKKKVDLFFFFLYIFVWVMIRWVVEIFLICWMIDSQYGGRYELVQS